MDGEGEGMVAIVQALRNAGLAVTLMARPRASGRCKLDATDFDKTMVASQADFVKVSGPKDEKGLPKQWVRALMYAGALGQLTHAKSSVETSTKPLMSQTGAQICDDTYTSSYQLAHCYSRPSSPPIITPEFPLQRPEFDRTQGNFQIGSGANDGTHSPNVINLSARNGFMIPNKGSQSSRGTESFVQNLRKYPSISTERSTSTDLVQRILVYTQAKNFSKDSSHLKRIKNLTNKNTPEKPADIDNFRNKSVQTYTRSSDGKKRSRESSKTNRSSIRDSRYTSKNNQVYETFDYLRSTSPRPFNVDREVRYLNEMTRRLKDVLQPICDHRYQECPYMQSRYNLHRRHHHGATSGQKSTSDLNNMAAQAAVQMVSTGVPNLSSSEHIPGTQAEHSSEQFTTRCSQCLKPPPCYCSSRSSLDFSVRESGSAKKLEDLVYDWLKEIPVFINEKPEDQLTRQCLVQDLIDRLNNLSRDEFYEENAKNEILECVNSLPMWQPMSKRDQEDFKYKVIDNLINKIKLISRDSDDDKVILEFVDNISFHSLDRLGELVDKQDLKNNLIHKLNDLITNPPLSDKLKSEVIATLKEFPIKIKDDKTKYISNLGDKFIHKLKHLLKDTTKCKSALKDDTVSAIKTSEQRKRWNRQYDGSNQITKQITRILDDTIMNIDTKSKNEIKIKILPVITKNFDRLKLGDNDDTLIQLTDIIEEETQLSNREANNTAKVILQALKTVPQDSRLNISEDSDFKNALKEEIHHILHDIDLKFDNRDDMEMKLSNVLAEQIMCCETDAKAKIHLTSILKSANISDEESETIATDLIGKGKLLSLSYSYPQSSQNLSIISKTDKSKTPKDMAYNKIKQTILDYTNDITGNTSISSIRNYEVAAESLAKHIIDILYSDDSSDEEKKRLQREVKKYFGEIDINYDADKARELVDKLQNLTPKTSTPRRSIDKGLRFRPLRSSDDSTLSAILSDKSIQQFKRKKSPSKAEEEYTSELVGKIDHWMRNLDINSKDQKAFIDIMVRDLASDIVDRQKYLQLNRTVKTSEEEELEHLNYQVFRWLSKLPDFKSLLSSLATTKELMNMIKTVAVPKLIITDNITNDIPGIFTSTSKQIGDLISVHKEISTWMESIPSDEYTSLDKDFHRQMIKKLAEDINQLQSNDTLTETALDNILSEWLHKMVYDQSSSGNLSEGLKAVLINKKLVSFSPDDELAGKSSRITQEDVLISGIDEWMKTLPIKSQITFSERRQLENIREEIKNKLKGIKIQMPSSKEFDENHKASIKKYLLEMPLKLDKKKDEAFLKQKMDELQELLHQPVERQPTRRRVDDSAIKNIVHYWSQNLPFQKGKTVKDITTNIDNFVSSLRELFQNSQFHVSLQKRNILEEMTSKFIKSLPLQMNKLTNEYVSDLISKLLDFRNSISIVSDATSSRNTNESVTTSVFKNSADVLYDELMNWCEDLPIQTGNLPNEQSRIKTLKQNIVSKLITKIADFNMQPEIFNDDLLYEDLLRDEVDELLSTLPLNSPSQGYLKTLKNDFLDKVKKAKKKIQNELAGHTYKQQLRDAISNTLPSTNNILMEQTIPFEILKDNLAEAFIKLFHSANSVELKNKYKQQINNEVTKFCNEYLKRFPATPMDPKQLNQQLYTVLQNVPVPKNETIKTQVEQMRIKDEIIDCLNNLPLDYSPSGELQKRKIASILAKELHDIEEEKDSYQKIDKEHRMKQNIIKWVKKLPVIRGEEFEIDKVTEKLLRKLKSVEDNRINNITKTPLASTSGNFPKLQQRMHPSNITSGDNLTQYTPPSKETLKKYSPPKSTLSSDNREHLERIRQRVKTSSQSAQSIQSKDISVSPKPVEAGNQTEIGPQIIQPLNSNQPISPNVVVNEYNWENTDPTMTPKTMHYAHEYQMPKTQTQTFANTNQSQLPLINQQLQSEPYTLSNQNIQELGYHDLNQMQTPLGMIQRERYSLPNQNMQDHSYRSCMSEPPLSTQTQHIEPHSLPTQNMQNSCCQNTYRRTCESMDLPPCMVKKTSLEIQQHSYPESPQVEPFPPPSPMPQTQLFSSRSPPGTSRDVPRGSPPGTRAQSRIRSPDISSSSPYEQYDETTKRSYKNQPRVTKLGSFDDTNRCSKCCGKQPPKSKQRNGSPDEDFEWTMGFPENTDFTPGPKRRPRPCRMSMPKNSQLIKERKEEKTKCQCTERILTKCVNKTPKSYNHTPYHCNEPIHHCPKCYGMHCPHPSYLFFK